MNITKKKKKQSKIILENTTKEEKAPSISPTHSTDCRIGDMPVTFDDDTTLRLLSNKTRGFNFIKGKDSKINTGIEYLQEM